MMLQQSTQRLLLRCTVYFIKLTKTVDDFSILIIGSYGCCAVIELFPEAKFGFNDIHGFANIARNLGAKYFRYRI